MPAPEPYEFSEEEKQKLKLFLAWFDRVILKNKKTRLEKFSDSISFVFASIGDYPAIPLGNDFGKLISKLTYANQPTTTVLSVLFSIIAYIPTSILYNVAAKAGFREIFGIFSPDAALFNKQDRKFKRKALAVLKYFLAPFASVPFMAYTKKYQDNDLGTAIASIIFIASFACALRAESMIFESLFTMTEIETVKAVKRTLNTRIDTAVASIKKMPEDQLGLFYQSIMTSADAALTEEETLVKVRRLLNPPQTLVSGDPRKILPTWYTTSVDIFSLGMGAAAMYSLNAGADMAAEWFCNSTGITDDNKARVKFTVIFLAILVNTLFCGFYAKSKLRKTSDAFFNKEFCPTAASSTAIGFSLAASTMNAVIAQQSGNSPFLIAPSVIMPTAMRLLAFEMLINACKRRYTQYRFPNSATAKRETLINLLVMLKSALELMDSSYIITLENASRILSQSASENQSRFLTLHITDVELGSSVIAREAKQPRTP